MIRVEPYSGIRPIPMSNRYGKPLQTPGSATLPPCFANVSLLTCRSHFRPELLWPHNEMNRQTRNPRKYEKGLRTNNICESHKPLFFFRYKFRRLSFGERLNRRRAHCPACGEYAGEQCRHGRHGEYDAVNAPFEREHHFAVHTEHHVCAQPAEQGAK